MTALHTQLSREVLGNYIDKSQPKTDVEKTKFALQWAVDYSQKCVEIIQSGVHDPSEIERILYAKRNLREKIMNLFA